MITLNATRAEAIDQLCKRRCAFALYRFPHSDTDHFCMQWDGGFSSHGHITQIASCKSFVMAPYLTGLPILQIEQQRESLPDELSAWSELTRAPHEPCPEAYENYFAHYHHVVDSCTPIQKLVLARCKDIATEGFSPARAYQQACESYAGNCNILVHSPLTGTWLSSTPELLLAGKEHSWQTQALAGTQKHGEQWSEKNLAEQRYVSKHIREVLRSLHITYSESPTQTLRAGQLEHLSTRYQLHMPPEDAATLLASLAPTPAVAGYPCEEARAFLQAHPDIERGYYTGYLGHYDPRESSALYVCLRCMQIFDHHCRLYAGGGIMSDSRLSDELEETEQKMQAMLTLITAQKVPL